MSNALDNSPGDEPEVIYVNGMVELAEPMLEECPVVFFQTIIDELLLVEVLEHNQDAVRYNQLDPLTFVWVQERVTSWQKIMDIIQNAECTKVHALLKQREALDKNMVRKSRPVGIELPYVERRQETEDQP